MKLGLLGLEQRGRPVPPLKSVGGAWPPGITKCSATQNVDVPVPHVVKEILDVIKDVPQDRASGRIIEQNVVAPCGRGCSGRMECELEELQRLRAQQESGILKVFWCPSCKLFCCSGHDRGLSLQFFPSRSLWCS